MQIVIKQIISIVAISIIFGFCRFFLIEESDFTIIKSKKILKEITQEEFGEEMYVIPELMTEPLLASTEFTKHYFDNGKATIIDARDKEEYNHSHIQGALNIPYYTYEEYNDQLENLPLDGIYIIYCNGEECSLSLDLAYVMFDELDFENIFIYESGLPAWEKANYPTVKK